MAEKDITEKNLEEWNDVFADIANVLLFNGNRLMKESELEDASKESQFKADGKIHEQERDVAKFWRNGEIRISIFGFENQTRQDYRMPLRVMSYDGASYKQQLLDDKLFKNYPVVTLVLYFGTDERWTAPKNLCSCFDIPEDLMPFVSDYNINVFEIAWLDDETISKFQSDFKFVAKYFQTKRLNRKYVPSNEEIRHVDALLKTFAALTGDKYFETIYNDGKIRGKGGTTMCDIVQGFVNEGIEKGIKQGIEQGIEQGLEQGIEQGIERGIEKEQERIIMNLIESNAGSIGQIAAWVKLPVEQVQRIAEKVPAMD